MHTLMYMFLFFLKIVLRLLLFDRYGHIEQFFNCRSRKLQKGERKQRREKNREGREDREKERESPW